ncbi:hypothetical protein RJ640_024469 [Escallonia rubra]|uniref:Secretory carrier membrane protein n=1 Tax=Escallonia rubra TaxID=112253 RepID=A0AA88RTP9_9ASTE|nr:hypothetical protein RJ640_024469 [Escallonia rubra]
MLTYNRGILPAIDVLSNHALVGFVSMAIMRKEVGFNAGSYLQIFYFIGFGFFCLESLISIWVIQQVYMYFRGSGKAAEMRRDATRSTMMAAL